MILIQVNSLRKQSVASAAGVVQEIIDYSSDDASKYCYKTNVNHAIGVYKDAFIAVVLEPASVISIHMSLLFMLSRVTKAHFHLAQYHPLCWFPFHCTMGGTLFT
ncbi:MAG: hypothetical protein RR696_01455 [Clostridia bacterium]